MSASIVHETTFIYQLIINHQDSFRNCLSSAVMAVLHGLYKGKLGIKRIILNAMICALLVFETSALLGLWSISKEWIAMVSLLIGFMGVDYISNKLTLIIDQKIDRLSK